LIKADITTFYPLDDCSVDEREPNNNVDAGGYLAIGSIGIGGHPARYRFFMKFDLTSLEGKIITSAKFRLYCYVSEGSKPFYIRKVANDSWIEETITYNDKPDTGDIIYTGAVGEGVGWVEHEHEDITTYVDEEKGNLLSVWYGPIDTSSYQSEKAYYRDKEYDGGSVKAELVIEWAEPISPPPDPLKLFGAGFNASMPYVDLYWTHNLKDTDFFEVQNSTDKISWSYLRQNTTTEYHDFQVVYGTERYYRVRACNFTMDQWFNSTWTDIDFEIVYFSEGGGIESVDMTPSIIMAIFLIVIGISLIYSVRHKR